MFQAKMAAVSRVRRYRRRRCIANPCIIDFIHTVISMSEPPKCTSVEKIKASPRQHKMIALLVAADCKLYNFLYNGLL